MQVQVLSYQSSDEDQAELLFIGTTQKAAFHGFAKYCREWWQFVADVDEKPPEDDMALAELYIARDGGEYHYYADTVYEEAA